MLPLPEVVTASLPLPAVTVLLPVAEDDLVVAGAEADGVVAVAELDVAARAGGVRGGDRLVAVAAEDLVAAGAQGDGVVAAAELDVVVAVALGDGRRQGQAAGELEIVVAAVAEDDDGGEGLAERLGAPDVVEGGVDLEAGGAVRLGPDGADLGAVGGVGADDIERGPVDEGARVPVRRPVWSPSRWYSRCCRTA